MVIQFFNFFLFFFFLLVKIIMSFFWADLEVLDSRNPTLASSVGTIACVSMPSKAKILTS